MVCGIDWVTSNATRLNIKVANMSLGGSGSDDGNCGLSNRDALHKAICSSVAAGVTDVVAAGNDGRNLAGFVPAAASGVCIRSTWKGNGYQTISRTSMASPHTTGAAALCIAAGTCAGGPAAIIDQLRTDASVQGSGYGFTGDPDSPIGDRYYGYLVRASEY